MIRDILYPYQVEAMERIAQNRRIAIFDDPGLGKTLTVLGALEASEFFTTPKNALVLATRTGAALTWLPHADKFVPPEVRIIDGVRRSLTHRRMLAGAAMQEDRPTLVIANHDFIGLSPKNEDWAAHPLWSGQWDAIIIDESQRVLPTKAEHDLAMTQFWRGLYRLKSAPDALRVPMSGTPDRGLLENRYGTYAFMLPEVYNFNGGTVYEQWLYQNFRLKFQQRWISIRGRRTEVTQAIVQEVKHPQQWHELEDMLSIRRTKAEVAPQLPAKRYIDIELPFAKSQERAYLDYIDTFSSDDDGSMSKADQFAVRATQFAIVPYEITPAPGGGTTGKPILGADSPKRDWLIEWLQEREYDEDPRSTRGKVVITSQFSAVLKWLGAEFQQAGMYGIEYMIGDMSTSQRLAAQQRFQESDARIMLLSMTLGDSIDLDAADDMIFVDRVRDPDRVTQAEDRVHRVSRMHNVVIWRLITKGSVDEAIDHINEKRFNTTREHMDGRRGVDYARRILARFAA